MEIITRTLPGLQTEFEYDYIYNFLLHSAKIINNPRRIVVYSSNIRGKYPQDIQPTDILVHLSNENLKYNYRFCSHNNVVLRSYYHPFLWRKNCYAIPLGWQTGFANKENLKGEHNKYVWCFIGQIKGYRKPMYEVFKDVEPGFASVSEKWNSRKLTDKEVKQIYLDSAFALVPFGSIHADTMRIMETLEHGCIPVVIDYLRGDYYKYIFGNHPFIIGKNWEEAKQKTLALWSNKEALIQKRKEVEEWYLQYKKNLLADVEDILQGKRPTRGSQWKYQMLGHLNFKMLGIWYYHFYYKNQPIY